MPHAHATQATIINYKFIRMLILENLSLQAAKKSFMNSTTKFLKISINGHVSTSKQPAKVKSAILIEWAEPLSLPLFLNADYHFEIYEKHSFGYNPEELTVVGGKITIGEQDTYNSWEVVTDKGQKYGFLSANIRRKIRYAPNASTAPAEHQILSISSIVAHMNVLRQKRAFVQLKVFDKTYKTEITKSKAGELLFTELMELDKTDEMLELTVEVHSFDAKEERSELAGSGKLKMDPEHPEKRAVIRDPKNAQIGEVFIDYKVTPKEAYNASKELSKIIHKTSLLSRSIDVSDRNNHLSLAQSIVSKAGSFGNDSMLGRSRRSGQKPSVVHHNTNIFTPSEPRFLNYVDKQNQNVSYLREEKRDFDFRDKHAKVYYRGASIGKGDKCDFTNQYRSNPGVGVYNLPCIWDRY